MNASGSGDDEDEEGLKSRHNNAASQCPFQYEPCLRSALPAYPVGVFDTPTRCVNPTLTLPP